MSSHTQPRVRRGRSYKKGGRRVGDLRAPAEGVEAKFKFKTPGEIWRAAEVYNYRDDADTVRHAVSMMMIEVYNVRDAVLHAGMDPEEALRVAGELRDGMDDAVARLPEAARSDERVKLTGADRAVTTVRNVASGQVDVVSVRARRRPRSR